MMIIQSARQHKSRERNEQSSARVIDDCLRWHCPGLRAPTAGRPAGRAGSGRERASAWGPAHWRWAAHAHQLRALGSCGPRRAEVCPSRGVELTVAPHERGDRVVEHVDRRQLTMASAHKGPD